VQYGSAERWGLPGDWPLLLGDCTTVQKNSGGADSSELRVVGSNGLPWRTATGGRVSHCPLAGSTDCISGEQQCDRQATAHTSGMKEIVAWGIGGVWEVSRVYVKWQWQNDESSY
jgi:hypothetical protein